MSDQSSKSGQTSKSSRAIKVFAHQKAFDGPQELDIVQSSSSRDIQVKSTEANSERKKFVFDHVFRPNATLKEVYDTAMVPLIQSTLEGFNSTMFLYGRSDSGKSDTFFGDLSTLDNGDIDESMALIPRTAIKLFSSLAKLPISKEYTLRVSMVHVYNEQVHDLFNENQGLRIYEDPCNKNAIYIKDVSSVAVTNGRDLRFWLQLGLAERNKNYNPVQLSRGHLIVSFEVTIRDDTQVLTSRLQFVELAGCENTKLHGEARFRDTTINRSLVAFTNVVKALGQKNQYVNYRESKLTRLLQDSLGGTAKSSFLLIFTGKAENFEDTVKSFELGQLVRLVANNPKANIQKVQRNVLKELDDEIERLKKSLDAARKGEGVYVSAGSYEELNETIMAHRNKIMQLVEKIAHLESHAIDVRKNRRQLEEALLASKEILRAQELAVAENDQKAKESEQKLSEMRREGKQVAKIASDLLEQTNKMTEDEQLYHDKYQDTAAASTTNMETAKQMGAVLKDFFKDVNQNEKLLSSCQSEQIDAIQNINDYFSTQHVQQVRDFDETTGQIQSFRDQRRGNLEGMVETMSQLPPIHCDFAIEVPDLSANLQDINSNRSQFQTSSQEVDNKIDNSHLTRSELIAKSERLFHQAAKHYRERLGTYSKLYSADGDYRSRITSLLESDDLELRRLQKARDSFKPAKPCLLRRKVAETKSLDDVRHSISDQLVSGVRYLATATDSLTDICTGVNQQSASFQEAGSSRRREVSEYVHGWVENVHSHKDREDQESSENLTSWAENLDKTKEQVLKEASERSSDTQTRIEVLYRAQHTDRENIRRQTTDTMESLTERFSTVMTGGNVAETPPTTRRLSGRCENSANDNRSQARRREDPY